MLALQITATVFDGTTVVPLEQAEYDAALQRSDLTVAAAGRLQFAAFEPIGGPRGVWVQMVQAVGFVPTISILTPSGQTITVPSTTNIWVPQGCELVINSPPAAPAGGSVEIWLWGINSLTFPPLSCCHVFAPDGATGLGGANDWKESAIAGTDGPIDIQNDLQPGDTIDAVTLAEGDRVLVKDQADATQNGIYVVPAAGGVVERSTDADQGTLTAGAAITVTEGFVNAETQWLMISDDPIVIGVTPIVWTQIFSTPLCNTNANPIAAGGAGTGGIEPEAARCDHVHPAPTAVAVTIDANANAEGVSTDFARADHTHQLTTGAAAEGDIAVFEGGAWTAKPRRGPPFLGLGSALTLTLGVDVHLGFRGGGTGLVGSLGSLTKDAEYLACGDGRVPCVAIRQVDTAGAGSITFDVFVEVDTGAGFVKTVVASGVVVASGACEIPALAPIVTFAACDRVRVGVTPTAGATLGIDLELTVEMEPT